MFSYYAIYQFNIKCTSKFVIAQIFSVKSHREPVKKDKNLAGGISSPVSTVVGPSKSGPAGLFIVFLHGLTVLIGAGGYSVRYLLSELIFPDHETFFYSDKPLPVIPFSCPVAGNSL